MIALTPLTSGAATSRLAIAQCDLVSGMRWTAAGVKGRLAAAMGGSATFMPVVGRPGEAGALTLDGAYENYLSMAGPTWRNEIDAGVGLQLALVRSSGAAAKLRCPLLVQIADFDRFVPAESIAKVAVRGGRKYTTTRATTSTCGPATSGSTRSSTTKSLSSHARWRATRLRCPASANTASTPDRPAPPPR